MILLYESYFTCEPVVLQLYQVEVHWSSVYLWVGQGEGMFIFLLVSDFFIYVGPRVKERAMNRMLGLLNPLTARKESIR